MNPVSPLRCQNLFAALIAMALLCAPTWSQEPEPASLVPAATGESEPGAEDAKPEKRKKLSKRKQRAELQRRIAALPELYQQWLTEVDLLISDDEKLAFLDIEEDYQRDAFIERFWKIRDPYGDTARNEFRKRWYDRLAAARQAFGSLDEDRARYMLLSGPPTARIPFQCTTVTYPLEVWFYRESEQVGYEFFLVFVRRFGMQEYTIWRNTDRIDELFDAMGADGNDLQSRFERLYTCKDGEIVSGAIARVMRSPMEYEMLLAKVEQPSANPSAEWVATFASYSTDIPDDAETLDATLELEFPARYQARTVMQANLSVEREDVGVSELAGARTINLEITGEILLEGKLFENFRYRFDFPEETLSGDQIPLMFERRLRPGDYQLRVKVDDLNSARLYGESLDIEVPLLERQTKHDEDTEQILDEAEEIIAADVPTVEIVPPIGEMQTGLTRFETLATGQRNIAEVRFALDGRVVMQKRRAPYSVELDLGSVPQKHVLRVSAHDKAGVELDSDELVLNAGRNNFDVRFTNPVEGEEYSSQLDATVDVETPEGVFVERVELYFNETLLATLYQEPFKQRIPLPEDNQLAYVRAVAYLPDGNSTEDLVYINAPDYLEIVDIQYVELYTSVVDRQGRPVSGLTQDDFRISEDGVAQSILRFDKVENLPIHMQVMIDVSASMEESLSATKQAALQFFETALTPKDRAALVTFYDHPHLAVDYTNEVSQLAGGLAGLKAERGTSLYDSLIFGLYYLNGIKGQRAMLLLSDGKDESSRFQFEETIEYARRSGVAIYTIGLALKGKDAKAARKKLADFSDETGGRSYFIDSVSELAAIYQQIQQDLRSRYLITYQSTNSDSGRNFRRVEASSTRAGVEVRTIRGYYP